MSEYKKLKETQKKLGSALTCTFKKNGEMLIFVTANADNEEVISSLIQLSVEVSKHRNENKELER